MTDKNLKVGLQIDTDVKNLKDLNKMIDSLEKSGEKVDFLRLRSKVLAQEWDKLKPAEQSQRIKQIKDAAISAAQGTDKLQKSTERLGKTSSAVNGKLKALAVGIASYFSVKAISGFFTSAISGAANLETQLDKVQAVSGATAEEMRQIEQVSNELGSTTKYTATQAAEGFEILARAGLNASESIITLPAVLSLAQASGLELGQAASFITKAVAGMNLPLSESAHVADVLATAAANANTNVEGLGQALSYAAPTANSLGVSLEDTVAIIGKFADAGIDASRAGTALNNMMAQFSNPASKFKKELADIGINTDNFVEALAQLEASGQRGAKAINAIGMEAGPALKALLAQGMSSVDELSEKLKNSEGAAKDMAATMSDNLQGSIKGLSSVWETLKNTLGKPFLPRIKLRVEELAKVIKDFVDSGKVQALGKVFAENFDKMAGKVIEFVKGFKLGEVKNEISDFTDSVAGKLETLGDVSGGIYNTFATFGNAVKTGTYAIANAFTQVGASVTSVIPGLDNVSNSLQKIADESAVKVVESADDLTNSAVRLRGNFDALTESTDKASVAADRNATAGKNQADAIHNLKVKTEELKQQEKDYAENGKKNSAEYNQVVKDRINLETELADKIEEQNRRETELFNQKTARLQELKQLEADYVASGKQGTEEYSQIVKERAALEDELAAKTKNKILLANEEIGTQKAQVSESRKSNEVVKESAETTEKAVSATKKQVKASGEVAKKTKDSTKATKENAESSKKAAKSTKAYGDAISQVIEKFRDYGKGLIAIHGQSKLTAEQMKLLAAENEEFAKKSALVFLQIDHSVQVVDNARNNLIKMAEGMRVANEHMQMLESKISDGSVATSDLNVQFERLDNATLNKLNATIDKAKQKIQGLADEARKTAEDLDAELARLKGDDSVAQELEQKRKLAELEEKLAKARERQNIAEIEQYERAIELQRQIYAEKKKQYEEDKKAQADRDRQAEERRKKSENKHSDKTQNDSNSSSIAIDDFNLGELPPVQINTDELANKFMGILEKERDKTAKFTLNTLMDDIEREAKSRGL